MRSIVGVVASGPAKLPHSRMRHSHSPLFAVGQSLFFMDLLHGDLLRLVKTQGQFIAEQFDLNRVAHWRDFLKGDFCFGCQPHVQQVMAERAASTYGQYIGALSGFQLIHLSQGTPSFLTVS